MSCRLHLSVAHQSSCVHLPHITTSQVRLGGDDSEEALADNRFGGCIEKVLLNSMPLLMVDSNTEVSNCDTTQCITSLKPNDPCNGYCENDMLCEINLSNYKGM